MEIRSDPKNPTWLEVDQWIWDKQLILAGFAAENRHLYPGRRAVLVKWDNDQEYRILDYVAAFEFVQQNNPSIARSGRWYREEWAREIPRMDPDRTFLVVVTVTENSVFRTSHYLFTMAEGKTLDDVMQFAEGVMEMWSPEVNARLKEDAKRYEEENRAKGRRKTWWRP